MKKGLNFRESLHGKRRAQILREGGQNQPNNSFITGALIICAPKILWVVPDPQLQSLPKPMGWFCCSELWNFETCDSPG